MDRGRGDGCEEEVAWEDHDGVGGEEGEEIRAGLAEGGPGAVFEGAGTVLVNMQRLILAKE